MIFNCSIDSYRCHQLFGSFLTFPRTCYLIKFVLSSIFISYLTVLTISQWSNTSRYKIYLQFFVSMTWYFFVDVLVCFSFIYVYVTSHVVLINKSSERKLTCSTFINFPIQITLVIAKGNNPTIENVCTRKDKIIPYRYFHFRQ